MDPLPEQRVVEKMSCSTIVSAVRQAPALGIFVEVPITIDCPRYFAEI